VLLFSPVAGLDPDSGDIAYTEALLADPPPGVLYTTYDEAIDRGLVRVRGRRPRHGWLGLVDGALLVTRGVELVLRRTGVMYREPTWFVTIDTGAFDVVHQHLFAVRQVGRRVPVVSSAGYPLAVLYAARDRWAPSRVTLATWLERAWARVLDIHNPGLRATTGSLMTVYSERFREHLIGLGVDPEVVRVCGTGLPDATIPARRSDGHTVGFIGRDFEPKGGIVALGAFVRLRRTHPALRLRIITTAASASLHVDPSAGAEVVTDATNDAVVNQHLPEIDVLLLPTAADCGAPYSVLEGLRAGVCVVTSDYPWLDDRLVAPGVLRVPADEVEVAAAVERLLEPAQLEQARAAARDLWAREFSMDVLGTGLAGAYSHVLGGDS
jgi:glycosyltransferase involved in cell wall biosynthesis